jgi:outer membrane protein OmpA-like peptidoglycan-associated protein
VPITKASDANCPDPCKNGDLTGEVLVGAGIDLTSDLHLSIGGGTALVPDAARAAKFRVIGGLTWQPSAEGQRVAARGDSDGDGIPDGPDACPDEPEDSDGFQDDDGCPELDNDSDGVLDAPDQCPDEPETVNGYQDLDGCPDQGVQGGPKLTAAEVDLQGERVDFAGRSDNLTRAAQQTLDVVASIMKANPRVRFRIEVGVEESSAR